MSKTKVEQDHLKVLQERMTGKTKEEQADIVRSYMKEEKLLDETPQVHLSDDQIRMIVDGSVEGAKKATEEAAEEVTRRYGLDSSAARSIAHDEVSRTLSSRRNFDRDCQEAAKVLRAMTRVASGRANFGELEQAYEAESEYLRSTGRESRAMSIGTDTTGGYLGGELFETMLYENVARHSMARKYATVINMTKEILRIPKLTASVTATQDAEAATMSSSQPTFDQFVLNTKKIGVLTKPFSVELFETADPALVPTLIAFMTREIAKKEDAIIFGTTAPGILSHSTNVVTPSGVTALSSITFDHMADLIYELDPQYIPDEDTQGSGIFTSGAARFWIPQELIKVLAKAKGNDNYHWTNVQELKNNKNVHGHEIKRVPTMSNSPSAGDKVAAFGDLGLVVCGTRPGFRIELQSQGTVDSVNLNETNSYALRVTEFFDADCIDDSGLSVLALDTE